MPTRTWCSHEVGSDFDMSIFSHLTSLDTYLPAKPRLAKRHFHNLRFLSRHRSFFRKAAQLDFPTSIGRFSPRFIGQHARLCWAGQ